MPSVADILKIPAIVSGQPRLFSGADQLTRNVRWVHITEHHDIARLMHGSELVLTTGVAWPDVDPTGVQFIHDLADAGAAAVVVELVRRFTRMPERMVAAATERELPLIGLEREIRFIDVTYAVHASIIDEQLTSLRAISDANSAFTRLDVEGATPEQVLAEVTRITSRPAVLETLARHVTAYAAGDMSPDHLLAQWESRSRRAGRVETGPGSSWLSSTVEARGQRFGRIVLVADDEMPSWVQSVLDRAAATLAVDRLIDQDEQAVERHAHGSLLSTLIHRSYPSIQWVDVRAETLGVRLRGNVLVGMVVIPHAAKKMASTNLRVAQRHIEKVIVKASTDTSASALVGPALGGAIAVLLSAKNDGELISSVVAISNAIHNAFKPERGGIRCVVGVGSPTSSTSEARRSIMDGAHAAETAPDDGQTRPFYQVADIGISGLAHMLRDDHRLQAFVESMLGSLISRDLTDGLDKEGILRAFLQAGANKSQAASDYGLSRPAFYSRLEEIEGVLRIDLSSPQVRTSLHVALLALEQIREANKQT